MTPTFQGEVLMRRWSDSSTQGVQVTFALPDAGELEPLKAKTGKRFMAVLVEIGDDERPVPAGDTSTKRVAETPKKEREYLGDLCYRAVQWCGDREFQIWLSNQFRVGVHSAEEAAECIKEVCEVDSRKKLDIEPRAAERFNRLIRGPYQKHLQARGLV
jgi:hypothetical protein